ncbi:efflux transporter periplasmic adaptor subunit, partial [Escherichia coli]|nr:efflux transporter periplasmic adaptor subunit [Escherichia coli]
MKRLIRYLVFVLILAGMAYGGYRFMPATSKTTPTEKAEKEEHNESNSIALSDAKIEAAGI